MDDVFAALAHPVRRALLDALRRRDRQTQSELESTQSLTRFGVMRHLKVLEEAGLIVTRKVGREKLHFLNPVPIRQVADRWISAYAAPFAGTITHLATLAERETCAMSSSPRHVWEHYIRASAETLWAVLTDDTKTPLWQHFNMPSRTEWKVGGSITFFMGDQPVIVGEVLEIVPARRFVHSFSAQWSPEVAADPASRVTWEIEPLGPDACKLTLVHDDFGGDTATSRTVTSGWPEALSRLKTLVETGQPFLLPEAAA